jgi:hypothetical protein
LTPLSGANGPMGNREEPALSVVGLRHHCRIDSHTKTYVCAHVFGGECPVLYVTRPDGDWCLLCGGEHADEASDYRVVGIGHVLTGDDRYVTCWTLRRMRKPSAMNRWSLAAFSHRVSAGSMPDVDLLSSDDLDAVERRCLAATPPPWWAWVEGRDGVAGDSFIGRGLDGARHSDLYLSTYPGEVVSAADYDFIAHARQDVPLLLAEVRRLREQHRR